MMIFKSKDITASHDLIRKICKTIDSDEFIRSLISNYAVFPEKEYDSKFCCWLADKLLNQVLPIYHVLGGDISKKRILDLGCGSAEGTYESKEYDPKTYEPWLCRALFELGAHPIGIDIGPLEREKFECHSLNLLGENSLKFLGDHSIDVAYADLLYDSPTLVLMKDYLNLQKLLIPQLERIVKPRGFFIEGA